MKTCFSHSPPAAVLRSRVIRLPPLPPLPERFFTMPAISCLGVVTGSAPGPLDSTTSTSPLGSVSSWRGCISPLAMPSIFSPVATFGVRPCFQPTPPGTCIGGTRKFFALGSAGSAPDCCGGSSVAFSLHPPSTARQAIAITLSPACLVMDELPRGGMAHGDHDMADGDEQHGASREPCAGRHHPIGVAAVHESIEDGHDDGEQVEPEVEPVGRHGTSP